MKKGKRILIIPMIICTMLGYMSHVMGQSIHFTQFSDAGFELNPAQVGAYYGTVRVGGIYRDQYRKVSSHPYRTTLLYVDTPLSYVGKGKKSWIGLGGSAFMDRAGIAELNTLSLHLSGALHYALDNEYKNVISIAGNAGYVSRGNNLNNPDLFFEEEISGSGSIGGPTSQDRNTYANDISFLDLGAGIMWKSRLTAKDNITLGLGLLHLNNPSVSFGENESTMPVRYNAHASYDRLLNKSLSISPRVYYSKLGEADQIQVQGVLGYILTDDFALNVGLGTRVGDALQILLGGQYKSFNLGLSYDYTTSDLANSATGGALELALSYIYSKKQKIKSNPKFICPQL